MSDKGGDGEDRLHVPKTIRGLLVMSIQNCCNSSMPGVGSKHSDALKLVPDIINGSVTICFSIIRAVDFQLTSGKSMDLAKNERRSRRKIFARRQLDRAMAEATPRNAKHGTMLATAQSRTEAQGTWITSSTRNHRNKRELRTSTSV